MFLAASRMRTRTDARAVPAPQRAGPPRELREALEGAAVITLTDGEQHGDVLPDPQALLRRADAVLVEAHDEWQISDRRSPSPKAPWPAQPPEDPLRRWRSRP